MKLVILSPTRIIQENQFSLAFSWLPFWLESKCSFYLHFFLIAKDAEYFYTMLACHFYFLFFELYSFPCTSKFCFLTISNMNILLALLCVPSLLSLPCLSAYFCPYKPLYYIHDLLWDSQSLTRVTGLTSCLQLSIRA